MRKKRKTEENYKMQQTVPMESPSEILGRHVDPTHFGEISHEKLPLLELIQKWDLLPRIASEK